MLEKTSASCHHVELLFKTTYYNLLLQLISVTAAKRDLRSWLKIAIKNSAEQNLVELKNVLLLHFTSNSNGEVCESSLKNGNVSNTFMTNSQSK